ncbi:uncharacterized protein G2W53_040536 [Senna tora]|uniref:Uncharacterized protein n=1 Tax=Senna tora TaxID=362788 RepID=A0A834VYN8_9FABA|nr:uncharacterized protein G2W53_040536 [Senna tora]
MKVEEIHGKRKAYLEANEVLNFDGWDDKSHGRA